MMMIQIVPDETRVVIVDPNPSDYAHFFDGAERASRDASGEIQVHAHDDQPASRFRFVSSAREALRVVPDGADVLWIINTHLPDLTGFDLYSMLAERLEGVPVWLVGDEYDTSEELEAYCTNAAMYACKPVCQTWLAEWQAKFAGAK
jgi:hypothetical protein